MHLAKPDPHPAVTPGGDRMPANTTRNKGDAVAERVGVFWVHPTHRLEAPGGSHAGMAETVNSFKQPRISAVVGRFDKAQRTEHRIPLGRPPR